ncbi:hypothetical protein DIS24_g8142 [Lasiodiplodia hormozganensis]|uniref:Uncharacterized protein n=1 Tax=Lasiodiplodia hormozganensis TaxID=869390 RepID=A0AA39Y5E1_9PEZI|nr:hypothetical protein DIS24_g8142 [Lasiodiplodia hormozganensis]
MVDYMQDNIEKQRLQAALQELQALQESEARTMKAGVEIHHQNHETSVANFLMATGELTGKRFKKETMERTMERGAAKANDTSEIKQLGLAKGWFTHPERNETTQLRDDINDKDLLLSLSIIILD